MVLLLASSSISGVRASHIHVRIHRDYQDQSPPPQDLPLPVFFFHGVGANETSGANFYKNLTTKGHVFTALNFCTKACSTGPLNMQVDLAIRQIREIIQKDPQVYAKGYIFVGHSQGGAIARAVIEEMDDHKVHTLISLAGAQNGIFYGPQVSDSIPKMTFIYRLGPQTVPPALFNFSKYTSKSDQDGKLQFDLNEAVLQQLELQAQVSVINLARSPVEASWIATNPFLPRVNNMNACKNTDASCKSEKERRRTNFLKLTEAHFFGSPGDDVIAPWQSSILGRYNNVNTAEQIRDDFDKFHVETVECTHEYQDDTYGLRTLDDRGGLFLHTVPDIGHSCWVADSTPLGQTTPCLFQPLYDAYIYPILKRHNDAA
uniref:Lysosomal thioesterase PPT2 n=1 Tax=Globisporangium ultimum (strain ATCC 200006 / CBS 805.95 / DAOM BR144) TaxID=431595 RepID=K3WY21_GLOUD